MKTAAPLLALLLAPFLPSSARAVDQNTTFHFTLIHAQNQDINDCPIDPALRESLVKLFGYLKYCRLGEATASCGDAAPTLTFKPNNMFHLRLNTINCAQKIYEFELLQETNPILKAQFVPKPRVPLIIRGPFYDRGNLILVIQTGP